jgi:hypothetical protein
MTSYQKKVRSTLCQRHPEFSRRMKIAELEQNPMLYGYWELMTKQSHRQGLDPSKAAKHFIAATRRKHFH